MGNFSKEEISSLPVCSSRIEKLAQSSRQRRFVKKRVLKEGVSIFNDETRGEPLIIRKALAIKKVLNEIPVEMEHDGLIVGRVRIGSIGMGLSMPVYATDEELKKADEMNISPYSVWGHYVPNYRKLLSMGIFCIRDSAKRMLAGFKDQDTEVLAEKRNYYRTVTVCCDGVIDFANRYAALAEQMTRNEKDQQWREELLSIAGICKKVFARSVEGFREALQSFWFMHFTFHSTMNFIPVGRFDQYMFSFFEKYIERETLDLDAIQQRVDALWIKFNDRAQPGNMLKVIWTGILSSLVA